MTEADLIEAISATLDIHLSTLLAYLSIVSCSALHRSTH